MGKLSDNMVLSRLTMTCDSGVKRNKQLETEAYSKHGIQEADRVRSVVDVYNTDYLKAARKEQTALRNLHIAMTTPWGEGRGDRLTPNTATQQLRDAVAETKVRGFAAWDVFKSKLLDHIERDRMVLGTLFDESLYPTEAELDGRFTIELKFATVPDAEHDPRAGWDKQTRDAYVADTLSNEKHNIEKAMKVIMGRAFEKIMNVAERCEDNDEGGHKKFFDTLIPNVKIVRDMFVEFDLTDDKEVQDWIKEMDSKILTVTPQELRDSDQLRHTIGPVARKLANRIKGANVGAFGKAPTLPTDAQ